MKIQPVPKPNHQWGGCIQKLRQQVTFFMLT